MHDGKKAQFVVSKIVGRRHSKKARTVMSIASVGIVKKLVKLCQPCIQADQEQGLVRGAEDEDNHISAARKVTRKQKDRDEGPKKIGKRVVPHSESVGPIS
jgi:hypothetical protein